MRILAVGDVEEALLHEHYRPERWQGPHKIDLLLSCGDLDTEYLDFLITVFQVPGYYVAGNHDTSYETAPPAGWDNLDGRLITFQGVRIAGLAGCMRYTQEKQAYQYTEAQMTRKAWRLRPALWRAGGADIFISHAAPVICPVAYNPCASPAGGERPCTHPDLPGHLLTCPDMPDPCHRGFAAFRRALDSYQPRYWLHGHNHLSYARSKRVQQVGPTSVINVYGHTVIEIATHG